MSLSQGIRCCRQDEAFCGEVTFHQFLILDSAAEKKELNISELHDMLSVEKSTTTRLVAPLIRKGLLKREKSEVDQRAARLVLTDKGREAHRQVWNCLAGFTDAVLAGIPEKRRKRVIEDVRTFTRALAGPVSGCGCNSKGGRR